MSDQNHDLAAILQDYVPRADYEAALQGLEETIGERDELRSAAQAHEGRARELEGKVRGRAYRDAYGKVAKELKVKDEHLDDVYELLKLAPDRDDPDEAAIRRSLDDFLKDPRRKGYVAQEREAPRRLEPGEGHDRGAPARPGDPELRVTRQQLNNARFMRDNHDRIREASSKGVLVIDD